MIDLPIAEPWWVVGDAGDGVTHIAEPHVHPILRCNVWHVRGRDRDLVVDTAMGLAPLRGVVETLTGQPLLAVATHAHTDHIGGMYEFDERAIHAAEAAVMAAGPENLLVMAEYGPSVVEPYETAGYDIPELVLDAVPSGGSPGLRWNAAPAPATRLLAEGDVVDLGDRVFEVLHLPGHSPGSIGLWEEPTGVLFSGDAVYDGPLLDELDDSDVGAYVATMRRLRELPVSVVHGGHEPSFGRDRLVELCDAYLRRRGA
jgi:glyoxylase-like metal-dependent hydrolase (beta-lactamase superfamily II)